MVASNAPLGSPPHIHNYQIQLTAGIVPMITIAKLQYALKNLRGEENYALA